MVTSLYSHPFRFVEDNSNLELDKAAHAAVSAGLYYQGLVFQDSTKSDLLAISYAFSIGIGYEVYQGFYHSRHGGFSMNDLQYNIGGIVIAYLQKEIWYRIKKIKVGGKKLIKF